MKTKPTQTQAGFFVIEHGNGTYKVRVDHISKIQGLLIKADKVIKTRIKAARDHKFPNLDGFGLVNLKKQAQALSGDALEYSSPELTRTYVKLFDRLNNLKPVDYHYSDMPIFQGAPAIITETRHAYTGGEVIIEVIEHAIQAAPACVPPKATASATRPHKAAKTASKLPSWLDELSPGVRTIYRKRARDIAAFLRNELDAESCVKYEKLGLVILASHKLTKTGKSFVTQ
jgi:hypothetical protein